MRARKLVLGGLIAVMLLGLVRCGGDGDDNDNGTRLGARPETADLTIDDKFPFYDKNTLELPLNQEVTVTVHNDGERLHNITIPGLNIDMDIAPGATVDIKVPAVSSAPRDGFFLFYCKFHQFEGEQGRLNISR